MESETLGLYLGGALLTAAGLGLSPAGWLGWRRGRSRRWERQAELDRFQQRVAMLRERYQARSLQALAWQGSQPFVVTGKQQECENVCSLQLCPVDGRPLEPFQPGQYVTLELSLPGHDRPVVRCYSLSDRPRPDRFRLTIKKRPPEPGAAPALASAHLLERVRVGDVLAVQAPRGQFFLQAAGSDPVVLIAGGIGITPLASMIHTNAAQRAPRRVYLFAGMRNGREFPLRRELFEIARTRDWFRIFVNYSRPDRSDRLHDEYEQGRLDLNRLRRQLPSNNFSFYLCGPGEMVASLAPRLRAWGVPADRVHCEAFGPASVTTPAATGGPDTKTAFSVTFAMSGKRCDFQPARHRSLLELAEQEGIPVDSGCRAGRCGQCLLRVVRGETTNAAGAFAVPDGYCLGCVSVPRGDITIEA